MSLVSTTRGGSDGVPRAIAPDRAARGPIARGQRARDRIIRAALEVLAESGLAGFTMEAVARRARASKATIYRRWATQTALLVDAMDLSFRPLPPPATGRLRTDLIELVSALETMLGSQPFPRLLAAMIDAAERDPAFSQQHLHLTEHRRQPLRDVLAEAQRRGEIAATVDLELAVDLLVGPAFYRRFIAHQPFPAQGATTVVDSVLSALRYTPINPPSRTSTPPLP
jgi:AcrR family transcriptional regulator